MQTSGWIQLTLFVVALAAITKPMGLYLMRVLDANGRTWLDPVLKPLERLTYRLMGVTADQEQDWKQYTLAMLLFSLVGCVFTYAILRLQHILPLNPQQLGPLSGHLAFNTAVSFTTNTNWQSYVGETTMSYLSQMVGLAFHNFVSAATGIAIAAALVRGIARHSAKTLGNFWVDLVRVTYYLLLPICLGFAVFLVSQGMIQNFKPYTKAKLVEPYQIQVEKKNDKGETVLGADGIAVMEHQTVDEQLIVQGPMASHMDGVNVLKRVREWSRVPVLVLSVREREDDKIAALDHGADDYITKPFNSGELRARLRVALRHARPAVEETVFRSGDLEVDLTARVVKQQGQEVKLTATEYALLRLFVQHAGKVLTHRQILREVWGPNAGEQTHYLRVYMAHLREKLESDPARPALFITEPGVGYRLKEAE